MVKEAEKEIKKILDKSRCPTCGRTHSDLTIKRVPKKTLLQFREWCDSEFEGDWGMGLKWLWDFFTGTLGKGHERAEALAMQALEQIAELKSQPQEEEKKTITTVDGQKRKIK